MVMAQQQLFLASEGKERVLRSLLNEMVVHSSAQKGCLKYELYQIEEERASFFLIEIWKSKARYHKHIESEVMQDFVDAIAELSDDKASRELKLTQCLTKQNYWDE